MKGRDSPLEAMPISPVNLGPLLSAAVNNLWAWLSAVFASAAFRFFRPKTAATCISKIREENEGPCKTTTFDGTNSMSTTITTSFDDGEEEKKKKVEEEGVLTRGNSSKELFRVCFEEERENEGDRLINQHDYHDHDADDQDLVVKRWRMEMRRVGDLGWYGYQDMKVIDGSVVRLWEEERERCNTPRRYRRRYSASVAITAM